MKKHFTTVILILILLAGLSLLLYPIVSDLWNKRVQTRAIASYVETLADTDNEEFDRLLRDAEDYNKTLIGNELRFMMDEEAREEYMSLLNVTGNGIMSYVEIPVINVVLPIYHGTDESVLQIGVGHLEGSSLPVGGESTHCVLSGHRGLPSAKLFTNLNKLKEGDTFFIRTLDELLTYEVDSIAIVLPHEVETLEIIGGKDYCTLITCTPYGVNSHRLLVRGTRVANPEKAKQLLITAEAFQIDSLLLAPIIAAPILFVLFLILILKPRKKHYPNYYD